MSGTRKTDRRTLYTIQAVKDSLLDLLGQEPFEKIRVAKLCRQAEITRTTFYTHFTDLTDALNQVIDDALLFSQEMGSPEASFAFAAQASSMEELKDNDFMFPACQRLADAQKYRALFRSPSLNDYIVGRIARKVRPDMVPKIMKRTGASEAEAELILSFTLHGSFAVNQRLGWTKDDSWYRAQQLISRFIEGGYQAI